MAISPSAVLQCVEHESEVMQAFIVALESEAEVLSQGQLDDELNACTAEKNRCAEELTRAAEHRDQLLQAAGFKAGKEGMDAAAAEDAALEEAWKQLLELVAQASELNRANGALIERLLKQNNEALHTLRALAGGSNLYDATGRASQVGSSRTSIRAG